VPVRKECEAFGGRVRGRSLQVARDAAVGVELEEPAARAVEDEETVAARGREVLGVAEPGQPPDAPTGGVEETHLARRRARAGDRDRERVLSRRGRGENERGESGGGDGGGGAGSHAAVSGGGGAQ